VRKMGPLRKFQRRTWQSR